MFGWLYTLMWRLYAPVYDSLCQLSPYQAMLRRIAQTVWSLPDVEMVLDAGCGTGNVAAAIRASNASADTRYYGIDSCAGMLERARTKHPWLSLKQGSLEEHLPYEDDTFDVVVISNVLYTLIHYRQAIAEMLRVLRPHGHLIVTTPRHDPDIRVIVREHIQEAGFGALLRHLPALVTVGILNLFIVRSASYTFFTKEQLFELMHADQIDTTYAGQVWFASVQKEG